MTHEGAGNLLLLQCYSATCLRWCRVRAVSWKPANWKCGRAMKTLIEHTQAELDRLYAALLARAGDPTIDTLLEVLRSNDDTLDRLREAVHIVDEKEKG